MAEYIDRTQLALTPIDITDLPRDKALLVYEKEEVEGLPTADVIERDEYKKVLQDCRKIHDENNELIAGFRSLDAKYAKLNEGIHKAISDIELMLEQEKQADGTYTDVGQGIAIAIGLLNANIGE